MVKIAQQSMQSLMLTMSLNGTDLASGTGFIVRTAKGLALITSRHNVTGRYQGTGKPIAPSGAVPNEMVIHHPAPFDKNRFNPQWEARVEPLYAGGRPRVRGYGKSIRHSAAGSMWYCCRSPRPGASRRYRMR